MVGLADETEEREKRIVRGVFGFYSGFYTHVFFKKESRMHAVLNEVYLQKILGMSVTFRDESSDGN